MKRQLSIAVAIATYNREDVLCATLKSLVNMRHDEGLVFEIQVFDQTSEHNDNTKRYLDYLINSGEITYHTCPLPSLTKARNLALEHIKQDIILYIDDDVEPVPGFIQAHLRPYYNSNVWAVAGCVLNPGAQKIKKENLTKKQLKDILSKRITRFDVDWSYEASWAMGCNMSFRREALVSLGGFDENFYGVAIGEDVEMSYRLRKAGGVILYSPDAALVHLRDQSGGCRSDAEQYKRITSFAENVCYYLWRIDTAPLMWPIQLLDLYKGCVLKGGLSIPVILKRTKSYLSGVFSFLRRIQMIKNAAKPKR